MWTIRQDQSEAFRRHHLLKFENEMVEHLQKFSPILSKAAGESAVRQAIQLGVGNAARYGFTNRGPIRFYIELMFLFGSFFDTDRQCEWAATVLNEREPMDQSVKADFLYASFNEYEPLVFGPDRKFLTQAKERLSRLRSEAIEGIGKGLTQDLAKFLRLIYPEKYAFLGSTLVNTLVQDAVHQAQSRGLADENGRILAAVLAFTAGYRFLDDPLYSWLTAGLETSLRSSAGRLNGDAFAWSVTACSRCM
jgi:hypothetical protein